MSSTLKALLLSGGLLLAYSGYNQPAPPDDLDPPQPDPSQVEIITQPPEDFPREPTYQLLTDSSGSIYQALTAPNSKVDKETQAIHALQLARAYREWALLFRQGASRPDSSMLKSLPETSHLRNAIQTANDILFRDSSLAGVYGGQIGKGIEASLAVSLARHNPPLAQISPPLLSPGKVDQEALHLTAEAFEACSHQAFRAFLSLATPTT